MDQYDVFISYSHLDIGVAKDICAAFDRAGITYFIDEELSGGSMISGRLADAIDSSRLMLYLASKNSYASIWTADEIHYAKTEKPLGFTIPYIIDDSPLPNALKLLFASCNQRKMSEHPIEPVLVNDVLKALGRLDTGHGRTAPSATPVSTSTQAVDRREARLAIGRNDLCPCGSGRKYKNCHGR